MSPRKAAAVTVSGTDVNPTVSVPSRRRRLPPGVIYQPEPLESVLTSPSSSSSTSNESTLVTTTVFEPGPSCDLTLDTTPKPFHPSLLKQLPIMLGPRNLKLSDFKPPFCHGFSADFLGRFYPDVIKGSRVLWLYCPNPKEAGLLNWAKLAFPEESYLYVDQVDDLKQFDNRKHKGVVVTGDINPGTWTKEQIKQFVITGTGQEGDESVTMTLMPKDVPRVVISDTPPMKLLTWRYKWSEDQVRSSKMANFHVGSRVVQMTPEIDPDRIKIAYWSKLKQKVVQSDFGGWNRLPLILEGVADFGEAGLEKKKRALGLRGEVNEVVIELNTGEGEDGPREAKRAKLDTSEAVDRIDDQDTLQVTQGQGMISYGDETVFEEKAEEMRKTD